VAFDVADSAAQHGEQGLARKTFDVLRKDEPGPIIERVSDTERDIARGLYGRPVPVRPAPRDIRPPRCLRGHDLDIAGTGVGYHHRFALSQLTCNICYELRDERASWCLVDPARHHLADEAPTSGLVLVKIPPTVPRGGVGQLQLRLDGIALADLDLAVCGPCQRAVLENVRVDEQQRRRGYGRVLVAAALTLAPPSDYHWSTTSVSDDVVTRAFWSTISWSGALGKPDRCTDMERAAGRLPDW
jgi:GNAT superfamily N-acetyltransferase